ncbi:MAG TPA: glutathione S-transferase N-terminal domain-containing protein [Hyphomonas sp.]|nr:glutathione S-transferase [Hyphomonas sp.]HRJ00129.1 glutathione S-transferase N-terminal domain-containing protein [Hyphomonas sp.]
MTVLYSFRRCPYAMRARMALAASGVPVRVREIILRDKPPEMLAASPKGTVPVLALTDGRVIDESLDVMHWALTQNDPEGWLSADAAETARLIAQNDGPLKHALDRYKYADLHKTNAESHRAAAMDILTSFAARIDANGGQLMGPAPTLADIAVFPFVRQFAATDTAFWSAHAPASLQSWLTAHTASARFAAIMAKFPRWQAGDAEPLLTAP